MARQYHPNLNKEPHAAEQMNDINWTKDILSDPLERLHYDLWRRGAVYGNPTYRHAPQPTAVVTPRRETGLQYAALNGGGDSGEVRQFMCKFTPR